MSVVVVVATAKPDVVLKYAEKFSEKGKRKKKELCCSV